MREQPRRLGGPGPVALAFAGDGTLWAVGRDWSLPGPLEHPDWLGDIVHLTLG